MAFPKWAFLLHVKKFDTACRNARDFEAGYVQQAKRQMTPKSNHLDAPERRLTLMQGLLEETNDLEDILNQLMNVFPPAHEATGVALSNLFFNLARNPTCTGS